MPTAAPHDFDRNPGPRHGGGGGAAATAIVIGASAGGVEAVVALARLLPPGLPAAVLVVIHTSPRSPGLLAALIDRAGPLPASYAADGEVARPGRIYVAPPDHHLVVQPGAGGGGVLRVWRGPKENGFRPAVDPLFRSAARAFGPRAIGVVLSGYLDDGTLGLMMLKRLGGVAVVQDPATAACPDMPRSAAANVAVDHLVPLDALPALLAKLAAEPPPPPKPTQGAPAMSGADTSNGPDRAAGTPPPPPPPGNTIERKQQADGPPSALTCPECGGALWERRVDSVMHYSCHVGHTYTGESLEDQYAREVEAALWTSMRHLVENAELHRRIARRLRDAGLADRVDNYLSRAEETERQAQVVRDLLLNGRARDLAARSRSGNGDGDPGGQAAAQPGA
jgi:two-component system chemotaxis response regulator CheB